MAGTPAYRPSGKTIALSVVAASHAAVPLVVTDNVQPGWVACINPGAIPVAIKFSQNGDAAVFPTDGTPGDFVLPALMQLPIVLPCPSQTPNVTAFGSGAGPTIIYVTPITYTS